MFTVHLLSSLKKRVCWADVKIVRVKNEDANAGPPSVIGLFPGAKAMLTPCSRADPVLCFETLKACIPDSFHVLCSDKNKA